MKSFKSAVSEGHAPMEVELAGVSVAMDANVGCKVLVGMDANVGCTVFVGMDV
jgi:hypothetical protein